MRFLRLLKDLVGLPAILVLIILALLGNLGLLADLIPQNPEMVKALTHSPIIGPVNGWLSQVGLPNWVFIFLLIILASVFEGAYRTLRRFYWPEPAITLTPKVEIRATPGGDVAYASLTARNNNERQAITQCYATLETAANLASSRDKTVTGIRNSRLRWAGDQSSDECTITLPPGSAGQIVAVADTAGGFRFSACKPSSGEGGPLGIYVVKVRLNGRLKGNPIEAQYFEGHLYVESARQGKGLTLLFERGDWKKNRRLPRPHTLRLGSRRFRLPW
jgi:hypothetical protein